MWRQRVRGLLRWKHKIPSRYAPPLKRNRDPAPSVLPTPNSYLTALLALRQHSHGGVNNVRLSCGHDWIFLLLQGGQGLRIQLQMGLNKFRRRQGQPLIERDIGVIAAREYLKEAQRRRAGVFDVMAHGERHVADIPRLVVEGARLA